MMKTAEHGFRTNRPQNRGLDRSGLGLGLGLSQSMPVSLRMSSIRELIQSFL